MPIGAWILLFGAPAVLGVARVLTWILRRLGYPRDRRPGLYGNEWGGR